MPKKIPVGRSRFALVDDADYQRLCQRRWQIYSGHYAMSKYPQRILMHRLIMQPPDDMEIDHINGNGLDNRRANLRICTHRQNLYNQRLRCDSTSGYKGVYRIKWNEKHPWRAAIQANGKRYRSKLFDTPEEAAREYDRLARKLHGEFARTNFPESQ